MHRHPKTFGERRAAAALATDEDVADVGLTLAARRGRSRTSLPSEYDDIPVNTNRSWKAHRRHQYKTGSSVPASNALPFKH